MKNTVIANMMTFMNKIREDGWITKEELRSFLVLLNPFAPFITAELYEIVFGGDIVNEKFPEFDESKTVTSTVEIPVQVKGKRKAVINVSAEADEAEALSQIRTLVSLLPGNNEDDASYDECTDDLNRASAELANCVGDTSVALSIIADDNMFFESDTEVTFF